MYFLRLSIKKKKSNVFTSESVCKCNIRRIARHEEKLMLPETRVINSNKEKPSL